MTTKINESSRAFSWLSRIGFFIILILPLITIPPYFFPPDWGKTLLFRSILAILIFLFAWQFLFRKNELALPEIKKNKIAWVLGALSFLYLLATIFSVDPYFSLWGSPYRGGGFVTFASYFLFAILAYLLLKDNDWKRVWNLSIITGMLVSLVGTFQYYGFFSNIFIATPGRPPSTIGNPDLLAAYLLLLFFITLFFSIKEKILWKKVAYSVSLVIFFYTILITGSRAAYLGLLVGGIYFLLWHFKKIKSLKIIIAGLLILIIGIIFYANTIHQYPQFLEKNNLFNSVVSRLSVENLIEDPRFSALQVELKIIEAKPLLGYGPENFSVGFDNYYNPAIPYLTRDVDWWDRAHNILVQTVSDAGMFALIAYLALFILVFWELQKKKSAQPEFLLVCHAIQAALIGYFVSNLFGFDSFASYLISFLLIAYAMHIIYNKSEKVQTQTLKNITSKKIGIGILFCLLIIFLWQYNVLPFEINVKINEAQNLVNAGQCDQGLALMDTILPEHSFLDSYARLEYVEFTKTCAVSHPENSAAYTSKDITLILQAVKIQPLYTRYWIFLATSMNSLASQTTDTTTKNNLLQQATIYEQKALALAPKHQEIIVEEAKTAMNAGNFLAMQNDANQCVALNSDFSDCYWYLAISQIYLKDTIDAQKNIALAQSKDYKIDSQASLSEISNAYGYIQDWKDLIPIYQQFILLNPTIAQYHASLAFFYSKVGDYAQARQEAMKVLQLSPQSKPNIDAFLQTLPQ